MTTLDKLNITDVEDKIKAYANLFSHRTHPLEGIRKITSRNMIHFINARNYLHNKDVSESVSVERIQAKMMSDQGLKSNESNRIVTEWVTHFPLCVYLALLYAEIEYYEKKLKPRYEDFGDDWLDTNLNHNRDFVNHLGTFRHSFLHPNNQSFENAMPFLETAEFYVNALHLQRALDTYLLNLRAKLDGLLYIKMCSLEDPQKLYCLRKFLEGHVGRLLYHIDIVGGHDLQRELNYLERMEESLDDYSQKWKPNLQQEDIANRLVSCLEILSPSRAELEMINPRSLITRNHLMNNIQTPMNEILLDIMVPSLITETQNVKDADGKKHVAHLISSLSGHIRLLMTGVVLTNEVVYRKDNLVDLTFFHQLDLSNQESRNLWEKTVRTYGMQEVIEPFAASAVILALLYESLRVYDKASKEDSSLKNEKLDEFISSGRLQKVKLHRHSIFHVLEPQKTLFESYFDVTTFGDKDHNTFSILLGELLEFYHSKLTPEIESKIKKQPEEGKRQRN